MNKNTLLTLVIALAAPCVKSQHVGAPPEYVKALTSKWEGPGQRMGGREYRTPRWSVWPTVTLEQIWGYLGNRGYRNQVEKNWIILKPGETMVGRVVTAQFMPTRPDLDSFVRAQGKLEGRSQHGGINIWPIDILTKGDIYVADGYGKIKDGTLIGSSLGNAIYGKTGKGVIFYGFYQGYAGIERHQGILTPGSRDMTLPISKT
jgi:hypothetical protein